jgi:ribosomal protein S18 acetylase RimI-like enzyme
MAFKIVPFDSKYAREGFDCGNPALNLYFSRNAGQDVRKRYAAFFVAVEENSDRVIGYYTLSNASVFLLNIPEKFRKRLPKYPDVPAIRLGRLAVDISAQGQGVGAKLLANAVIRSVLNIAAGWMMMIVDAKDENARSFYRKFEFNSLNDDQNHLYAMRQDLETYFGGHMKTTEVAGD